MIEESELEIESQPRSSKPALSSPGKPIVSSPPPPSSSRSLYELAFMIILPAVIVGYVIQNINNLQRLEPVLYNDVIPDARAYKWFYMENFFKPETLDIFTSIVLNGEELTTVIEDTNVDSAGEAVDVGHVNCRHPFMTLNLNRTKCHFSNRLGKLRGQRKKNKRLLNNISIELSCCFSNFALTNFMERKIIKLQCQINL